jgi:threonine dehydrogenase-like Zn-dependent dehydrogenase
MCATKQLMSQCETTQVREYDTGAALLGYTKLYGQVAGGQAEFLRVPQAQFGPIKVPEGPSDDRFLFLSDVLPTSWQAVEYANIPAGGTLLVLGLGPIGEMCCRIAQHQGVERVMAIDLVPERLERARAHGVQALDLEEHDDIAAVVREQTDGRGPESVIDAVGMEAHGAPVGKLAQRLTGFLPDAIAQKAIETAGIDRMSAIHLAIELVQRGGTVSLSGVYGGAASPMPLIQMFDKQINMRMGQANVKRWVDTIMPLLTGDDDPLGVESFATHHLPLEEAPRAYEIFQKKQNDAFKIVFKP